MWLLDRLADCGLPAVSVDLTTVDVAAVSSVEVVRVVVPGACASSPLGRPFLGGSRLTAALVGGPGYRRVPLPH